jgi:hypothetical protein
MFVCEGGNEIYFLKQVVHVSFYGSKHGIISERILKTSFWHIFQSEWLVTDSPTCDYVIIWGYAQCIHSSSYYVLQSFQINVHMMIYDAYLYVRW